MAQWYVKDLSKLTGVSVQTLHHYDRIDLLTPSLRLPNGYRVYSEEDLLRLQQILALKFFGFELTHINRLLAGKIDVREHFATQAHFLSEKAKALAMASETLQIVISAYDPNKSISWEKIIKLIEVFQMTKKLEKSWAAQVFTPEELHQYARFESGLKTRFTQDEKKAFEESWANLVHQIKVNLNEDPLGPIGRSIAKQVMELINGLYGEEHANLKHKIWEEGFKKGKMEDNHFLTPEMVAWLDQANDAAR